MRGSKEGGGPTSDYFLDAESLGRNPETARKAAALFVVAPSYYFKKILTVNEAADYLGIAHDSVYQYVYKKQLPCYKPSKGQLYFKKSELDEFMLRHKKHAGYEAAEQADAILNGEEK
ncbi:MAG: helix-turn-helix domain-containing protein [Treponema sp.]|nr:helix-turn-helix domain-containing protein [Treponema sp.]